MSWEYLISWIKPRKLEWEQKARNFQSYVYLTFEGTQYQSYKKNEYHVLDTDIHVALYVFSKNISTWRSNGSKADNVANKIRKTIVHVHKRYSRASTLRIGFIFLYCKDNYKEFHLPIFRVYTSDMDDECFYVDTHCRIYDSWLSWKNDNKLPMLKYCYPLNGFYTCSNDHEDISDRKREPILEFGSSPASKLVARLGRMLDVGSEIARYNNMFLGLIFLVTSLDSIKTMFAGVVGVAGAVYGAARSVQCLVDKNRHETSLLDAESLMHGLNILMIPSHVIMAVVNTPLTLRYLSQAISLPDILTTAAQKILSLTSIQRLGLIVLTLILHRKISEYLNTTHSNANKHIDKIKAFNLRSLINFERKSRPNTIVAKTCKIKEKGLKKFEEKCKNVFAKLNITDKNLKQATTVVISKLNCNHVAAVINLIELEYAGKSKSQYQTFLSDLQMESDITEQFVANLKKDCKEAERITKKNILKFCNNYTAVYHYRKHKAEFGSDTSMKVYLCNIPNELFQNKYLYSYDYDQSKELRVITYTNINGFQYGVLKQEKKQEPRIATIYKNEKFFQNWEIKWPEARGKLQFPLE